MKCWSIDEVRDYDKACSENENEKQINVLRTALIELITFACGASDSIDNLMALSIDNGIDEYELTPFNDYNSLVFSDLLNKIKKTGINLQE